MDVTRRKAFGRLGAVAAPALLAAACIDTGAPKGLATPEAVTAWRDRYKAA